MIADIEQAGTNPTIVTNPIDEAHFNSSTKVESRQELQAVYNLDQFYLHRYMNF